MKKVVRILLAILMVMCLTLGFTACKSECDKGNHTWDEGTITTAATCTQTGIKTFKCTACENGEKTEVIPKTDHTPVSADVTATCTQPGTTGATKCKDCGAVIKAGTPVDKLGHDYTGQPWKTENGKHYQECKRNCGARNEHQIGLGDWAVEGDQHVQKCTADGCNTITGSHTPDMGAYEVKGGRHISTCKVQGCNVAQGHDYAFGAWEAVGTKHVHTCTVEGCEIAEDHNANFGTTFVTTDETNHYKQCADCTLKTDEGAHDHDKLDKVSDSEHSVACSVCGHSFGNVAHNWVLNAEKSVESTCSVEGKNVYDCVCGAEKEEVLETLKHTMVWESDETNHTFKCSVCGHVSVASQPHGDDVVWNNTHVDEHWQWCKTCEHVFEDTRAPHDYSESFTCKDCDRTPKDVVVATFYKGEAKRFDTLVEAVQSITDDSEAIIYLGQSLEGAGIFIPSNRNINFRLQGNTYTVISGAVGSVKYESQAFHIEKDSNITIQNGTITSKSGSGVKMLVQNYANLTLMNNIVLDGTNLDADGTNPLYTLSNNFGATTIRNTTILVSEHDGVAFDVWYGMKAAYLDGVSVTLGEGNNIRGMIEYGSAVADTDWSKVSLVMQTDRNRAIRFSSDLTCEQANIKYADGKNVIEHLIPEAWSYADRHHFHECARCHAHLNVTECSETDVVTAKEPTCTETGTTAGVQCSVCKTVIEQPRVIPANGHVAGDEYIITDSGHTRKCTVCGSAAEKETAHIYVNSTCSGCGREIPVANIYALLHSLKPGESNTNGTFKLEGKVTEIDAKYKNNITISVTEGNESFSFYCYFVGDTDELKTEIICVGDTVTLTDCVLKNYNGTYEIDRGSKFSGYKGADCEINYENSANYTIDGLPAKAERYTTVEFTVTPAEGLRVETVKINDELLTPSAEGKYSFILTENITITVETVDANAKAEHNLKDPDSLKITNTEVGNDATSYANGKGTKVLGDVTVNYEKVIKGASDSTAFGFNNGNKNGVGGFITITAPAYILKVNVVGTATEYFDFICTLDDGSKQNVSIVSGKDTVITVQAKTFTVQVKEGSACLINSITITYGDAEICPNENTTHHIANSATCTTDGNIEYWECDTCHKYFADEKLVNEITDKTSVVIKAEHNSIATEWQHGEVDGKLSHWHTCANCNEKLDLTECDQNVKVDGKGATCTETGLTYGAKCSVCGQVTKVQTEIAALGHDYEYSQDDGNTHSAMCAVCEDIIENVLCTAKDDVLHKGTDTHWYLCICDRHVDEEAHTYVEGACECGAVEGAVEAEIEWNVYTKTTDGEKWSDENIATLITDRPEHYFVGDTVSFAIDGNYRVISVSYVDIESEELITLDLVDGKYTFTVTEMGYLEIVVVRQYQVKLADGIDSAITVTIDDKQLPVIVDDGSNVTISINLGSKQDTHVLATVTYTVAGGEPVNILGANGQLVTVPVNDDVTIAITIEEKPVIVEKSISITGAKLLESISGNTYKNYSFTGTELGAADEIKSLIINGSKQTSTVTDVPVTKTKAMTIETVDGKSITYLKLTFKQWSSKVLGTISIKITYAGGTQTITGNNEFAQDFDLSSYSNVTKIEVSSDQTSNQAGIAQIDLKVK